MLIYGAIVSALFARANGRAGGQRIETSLLQSAIALLSFRGLNYPHTGNIDDREGAGYNVIIPYGAYRCIDDDILIGAGTEANWQALCNAIDTPSLASDPRFITNALHCANTDALRGEFETILTMASADMWLMRFGAAGIPSAPINTIDKALDHPQVRANDIVVPAEANDGAAMGLLGIPFAMSGMPGKTGKAPPAPGQHNAEVLGNLLGITEAAIAKLADDGVI